MQTQLCLKKLVCERLRAKPALEELRLLINSDEADTKAATLARSQLQPQPPIPQQDPAGMLEFAEASDELFFAGALKTESCNVWRPLEHLGQAIFVRLESTICS
jgi:hypothetical protein